MTPEATTATATHTVRIYGASDDLIEIEGDIPGCDEYNEVCAYFQIAGLQIGVEYAGTWEVAVGQIDEDVPVTATDVRLSVDGYTMVLTMTVPHGSHVTRFWPDDKGGER